ncbi:phosphate ABC transporter substrate-binding protein PstS [Paucibacter sediminis]|uniref:Phosphate-binding protein PstS n=1 Tax=Paucibacter sediminis TaxID=3019553 RepID=A0AA95NLQ4_9BURK|nr:phosphate ABC transporter substrate-binding protein PstS [Paucibacter sp. S2-9]WIT13441.1 phosphate ABC transporter substrate-binding protein PstS [Paucibacter sp. S2-9]
MLRTALLALLLALCTLPAQAQVQGSGASFPSKVYERWAQAYEKDSGVRVDYRATGSGEGLKKISARAVHFGGSDTPLSASELEQRRLVQIPMLVGGIVPVVNLPGVAANRLQLSGELLAAIMAGEVLRWNDARIAAQNPGLALPALRIRRVVRADKSGSTEGFTRYLALSSAAFAERVGASQLPHWPGEVLAAEGNDGVSAALKANEGAIGYVSYDRVVREKLIGVSLRNADGQWVAASDQGFRSAIRHSDLAAQGKDTASLLNRPGADSWPITLTSFVLFDARPQRADSAAMTMRFLYWCFLHGDELTRGTGFAPLTVNVQSRLSARFASVRAQDGGALNYQLF